jgi:hypothetical protein
LWENLAKVNSEAYDTLFTEFLPRLAAAGLNETDRDALLNQDLQRALSQSNWG